MADLDGDGKTDLVTGSFDGGAWWMRRLPDGGFAKPQALLDDRGEVLRVGQYWRRATDDQEGSWQRMDDPHGIAAAPVDLFGDGRADLLLGTGCGRIYVARNLGGEDGPRFASKLQRLEAGGKPLEFGGKYAMPFPVDWDGDGRMDILVGTADGAVHVLPGTGERGKPSFGAPERLLAPSGKNADGPGQRVQVSAADVDGDGHLDLLVGDYRSVKTDDKRRTHGQVWWLRRLPAE